MAQNISFGYNVVSDDAIDSRFTYNGRPWLNRRIVLSPGSSAVTAAHKGLIAVDTSDNTIWLLEDTSRVHEEEGWSQVQTSTNSTIRLRTAFGENLSNEFLDAADAINATYTARSGNDAGFLTLSVINNVDTLSRFAELVHGTVPDDNITFEQTLDTSGYILEINYTAIGVSGSATSAEGALERIRIARPVVGGSIATVTLFVDLNFNQAGALLGTNEVLINDISISLDRTSNVSLSQGITFEDFGITRVYLDDGNLNVNSGYAFFENGDLEYNPHNSTHEVVGLDVSGQGIDATGFGGAGDRIFSYHVTPYPEHALIRDGQRVVYNNGEIVLREVDNATQLWRSISPNNTTNLPSPSINPADSAEWRYLGHTIRNTTSTPTGKVSIEDLYNTTSSANQVAVTDGNGVRLTDRLDLRELDVSGAATVRDGVNAREAVSKGQLDRALHSLENKLGAEIAEITQELDALPEQQAIDDRFRLVDAGEDSSREGRFVGTPGYRQYDQGERINSPITTFTAYRRGTVDRPDVSTDLNPDSPHPDLASNYPDRSEITGSNQIDWTAVYSAALNNNNLGPSDYYDGTTAASRHLPEIVDITSDAALAATSVSQLEADTSLILDAGVRSYASRYLNNNTVAQNVWDHRITTEFAPAQGFEHYRGHEDAIQVLNKIGGYYKPQLSVTTNVNFGNRDSNDSADASSHGFNVSFKWINADGFDYDSYHPLFSVYGGPEQSNEDLSSEFFEFPRFEVAYIPTEWDGTGFNGEVYDSFGGRVGRNNTFATAGRFVILATRPRDRDRGGNRQTRIIPLPEFNGDVSHWDGSTFCSVSFTFFEDENFSESGIGNEGERDLRVIKCRMSLYELSQNGIWYNRVSSHDNDSGLIKFNLQAVNQRTISELRVDQNTENGVWNRSNPILSFGLGSTHRVVPANNNELLDIPPLGFMTDININHAPITRDSGRINSGRYRNNRNNLTFDHFNNPGTVRDFTDGYNHIFARRGTRNIHAVNIERGVFRNSADSDTLTHRIRRVLPTYDPSAGLGTEGTAVAGEWTADVLPPQTDLDDNGTVWDLIENEGFLIDDPGVNGVGLHLMTIPHDTRGAGVQPAPRIFFDTTNGSTFESAEVPDAGERFTRERQQLIERVTGASTATPRVVFTHSVATVPENGNEDFRDIRFQFGLGGSADAILFNQIEEAIDLTGPTLPIFITVVVDGEPTEIGYPIVESFNSDSSDDFIVRINTFDQTVPTGKHTVRTLEYATSFVGRSAQANIATDTTLNEYFEDSRFPDRVFSGVRVESQGTAPNQTWQYVFTEANDTWDRIDQWPPAFDSSNLFSLVTGDRYSLDGDTYTYTGTGANINSEAEFNGHIPGDSGNSIWDMIDDTFHVYGYRGGRDAQGRSGLTNLNAQEAAVLNDPLDSRSRWDTSPEEINQVFIPQFMPRFTSDGNQLDFNSSKYHLQLRLRDRVGINGVLRDDILRDYLIQPNNSDIVLGLIGISRRFSHRQDAVTGNNYVLNTDLTVARTEAQALTIFISTWEDVDQTVIANEGNQPLRRGDVVSIAYSTTGNEAGEVVVHYEYAGDDARIGQTGILMAADFNDITAQGIPIPAGYETEPRITLTNKRFRTGQLAPIQLNLNRNIQISRHEIRAETSDGVFETVSDDLLTITGGRNVSLDVSGTGNDVLTINSSSPSELLDIENNPTSERDSQTIGSGGIAILPGGSGGERNQRSFFNVTDAAIDVPLQTGASNQARFDLYLTYFNTTNADDWDEIIPQNLTLTEIDSGATIGLPNEMSEITSNARIRFTNEGNITIRAASITNSQDPANVIVDEGQVRITSKTNITGGHDLTVSGDVMTNGFGLLPKLTLFLGARGDTTDVVVGSETYEDGRTQYTSGGAKSYWFPNFHYYLLRDDMGDPILDSGNEQFRIAVPGETIRNSDGAEVSPALGVWASASDVFTIDNNNRIAIAGVSFQNLIG